MDVRLRYTGGKEYDVSEDFIESISEIEFPTALLIARTIGDKQSCFTRFRRCCNSWE